jgi:hypothetical protein
VRAIILTFVGLIALMAVSAQAALSPNEENWLRLSAALSFGLEDRTCGEGWHRALWHDTRREGWWGACVPNWH